MISAKEARNISGETVEEKVEKLHNAIIALAKDGKRELRTGYQHKDNPELWINGGYSKTPDWQSAKKILEDLGYSVEFYYAELQFVDMYTIIRW